MDASFRSSGRVAMKRLWQALSILALGTALVACGGGDDKDSSSAGSSAGSSAAASAKIALDTAFGSAGLDKIAISPTTHDRFMAVAVGADGKTYAAGFATLDGGDQAMAVARLGANGGLDKTFGKDGIATVNVTAGGRTGELARGIVVLP